MRDDGDEPKIYKQLICEKYIVTLMLGCLHDLGSKYVEWCGTLAFERADDYKCLYKK